MLALKIDRREAQEVISNLLRHGLVDRSKRIIEVDESVLIPLISDSRGGVEDGEIVQVEDSGPRKSCRPIQRIRDMLGIPAELKSRVPQKWELIGDVLIFKMDPSLKAHAKEISKIYASVLGAKSVFEDVGGIRNEFRKPELLRLWGIDARTVHIENGIIYKLDASDVLFRQQAREDEDGGHRHDWRECPGHVRRHRVLRAAHREILQSQECGGVREESCRLRVLE
jgi:tRNA wybutosine-synthesizing protein 2